MGIFQRLGFILKANLGHLAGGRERPLGFGREGWRRDSGPYTSPGGDGSFTGTGRSAGRGSRASNSGETDKVDPKALEYYSNLEVPYGSDLETVRAAYRKLLRKYHPDLHHADEEKRKIAQQITTQLNDAYTYLKQSLNGKDQ
ncbi:MAG: J domain-containing protein [SAR324 cluster bacterium]|nr:J domain-containing protein [SAR324 cluster bacterium]